ncbi:uncharacterized protein LOC120842854 [Ixodes scapularis]|uniref:uncharacterized protein LOC120842854 n=1 Tax=Ixodes scapularis TaxID=6945 RepID=UPI001C380F2F|nr:uncharacterized protein LOC120842854 [Ixodes scapularis]
MLLITFLSMLLMCTFQKGESSSWPLDIENECTKLIKEGGKIACNLTGEGDYDRMSISNCWVTCKQGSNMFMLPHVECQRVLGSESWAGYQKVYGELPPYGFQRNILDAKSVGKKTFTSKSDLPQNL